MQVTSLKAEIRERSDRLTVLKKDMQDAEKTASHYSANKDQLEYMALQDQCFSVKGGEYTYNVCMLGSTTQVSTGGNTVTLGQYERIVPKADGSVVMEFTKGQHCHAFGARRASVHIACGADNTVLVVDEPSTCNYSFEMTSPAACNPTMAQFL